MSWTSEDLTVTLLISHRPIYKYLCNSVFPSKYLCKFCSSIVFVKVLFPFFFFALHYNALVNVYLCQMIICPSGTSGLLSWSCIPILRVVMCDSPWTWLMLIKPSCLNRGQYGCCCMLCVFYSHVSAVLHPVSILICSWIHHIWLIMKLTADCKKSKSHVKCVLTCRSLKLWSCNWNILNASIKFVYCL